MRQQVSRTSAAVRAPAVPEHSEPCSSSTDQRVSQRGEGGTTINEFSQIQPRTQQTSLRTARDPSLHAHLQENISPNALTRQRMFETRPRGQVPNNTDACSGFTIADELSDMILYDEKKEQPIVLAEQRFGEDFEIRGQPATLEQMSDDHEYIPAREPYNKLINMQPVRQSAPYGDNAHVVENPERQTDVSPDPVPQPQIAAVSVQSGQGSGPQTPPEQRLLSDAASSDCLRCREDYSTTPGLKLREEQLMPPPPPPAANVQRATATSVFEQLPQPSQRSSSPDKQPRSPDFIERQHVEPRAAESYAGLSSPNQDTMVRDEDNIFGRIPGDYELPIADSGEKRGDLLKLPARSHSSQVNLSPHVSRRNGMSAYNHTSFQRRRNAETVRQGRRGSTTFAENDIILAQNPTGKVVSNHDKDLETADNFDMIKNRASRNLKSSTFNGSPYAAQTHRSRQQLSSRQFAAVTPDKRSNRVPFQNMHVRELPGGLQLEFNWKINIHSLSQNRSRKGVDRDSSLTSGRKKSERRSKAAACDIRGFSTSKKLKARRQIRDDDDEQAVSPVKSFALGVGRESAGNSPAAPMVAQSQFLSSGSKRSRRVAPYMLPYLPPVQGGNGKQRTPPKDLPYPQVLGDTLSMSGIQAWHKAIYKANHQAIAATAQMYQQCHGFSGSGQKDCCEGSCCPSSAAKMPSQTNGVKMEGGKGSGQRKKNSEPSTSGKKSLAIPSSHDSEDAESEFESNEFGQMPYPYPPYFLPWLYPFYAGAQGLMPIDFQQEYGAFVVPAAPNSSQSSKPLGQGCAKEDEIISAASPDRLARSNANGRASDRDFTTSRKPRSGVAASDAPDTSQSKIVGMECSPAHTGRMYGRQNMPSATAAEASQNSQLSNEPQYFPAPNQWAHAGMPVGQGLQPPIGFFVPMQGAKGRGEWPNPAPEVGAEIEPDQPKTCKGGCCGNAPCGTPPQMLQEPQEENPESTKAAAAGPKSRSRNSGGRAVKRGRPTPSPDTAEANDAVLANTTVSKAASKKKRVSKAQRKDQSKQVTPTKRSRHAATVKKQKSGADDEPHNENTFDRPDDVNTTNAKHARRQAKDSSTLFPMTPLKVDASDSKDIAHGSVSLAQPSEPSQVSERPFDDSLKPAEASLTDQLDWLNGPLDEAATVPQNGDATLEKSEGENAPKRRRRKNYDGALLAGAGPTRINGVQRDELNKMNERKLEDQLERVLRQTLTQEELYAKIEAGQPTVTKCKGCKCRKGLCLKRYCECLRNNATCGAQCGCHKYFKCSNLPAPRDSEAYETRKAAIAEILKRKPDAFEPKVDGSNAHTQGCNCKNSKCQKAYCECFERRVPCTDKCKCIDCHNCEAHGAKPRERPESVKQELGSGVPRFMVKNNKIVVCQVHATSDDNDVDMEDLEAPLSEQSEGVDDKEMEDEDALRPGPQEGNPEIIGPDLVCIEALDPPAMPDKRKRRVKKDASKTAATGQNVTMLSEATSEKAKKKKASTIEKAVTRSRSKKMGS